MWLNIIVGIYFILAVALFNRYIQITNRERSKWAENGVNLSINKFMGMIIKDALVWPFHLIWYGIKQFIEELK